MFEKPSVRIRKNVIIAFLLVIIFIHFRFVNSFLQGFCSLIIYYFATPSGINVIIQPICMVVVALIAYYGIKKQIANNYKERYAKIMTAKKIEILDELRKEAISFLKLFINQSNVIHSKKFHMDYSEIDKNDTDNRKILDNQKRMRSKFYENSTNLKSLRSIILLYNRIIMDELKENEQEKNAEIHYCDRNHLQVLLNDMIVHVSYRNISTSKTYIYGISNNQLFENKTYFEILNFDKLLYNAGKDTFENRTQELTRSFENEIGRLCSKLWSNSKDGF